MSSVQYDVRKVFGRSVAVPRSSAIPYNDLDDVTMCGLALATLHHRGSAILIMLLQTLSNGYTRPREPPLPKDGPVVR